MKIIIVYDNQVYKKGIGLKSDWGFSCIIKTNLDTILFDTGANGKILLNNMNKLDIDPKSISKIIISHEHHDHNGGLKSLIPYLKNIELYRLSIGTSYKSMNISIPEIPKKISEKVWTTGRIKGLTDEQSLVLEGIKGWYILTGCSHPGLEKILQIAKEISNDNIIGVIGGFHGFNKFSVIENLNYICPCHCTAHKDDLKKSFPTSTYNCGAGKTIDLDV